MNNKNEISLNLIAKRNQEDIIEKKSKAIYWMRTVAIIAVISSHAAYLEPTSLYLYRLETSFSNAGVAIFFFAAGTYWKWRPLKTVLKQIANLLPAWVFFGLSVFWLSVLPSTPTVGGAILWLVGKNTYLWYLTVYSLLLIFFSLLKIDTKTKLVSCALLMFISRLITAHQGICGAPAFLNFMNWCGFFAIGRLSESFVDTHLNWKDSRWIGIVGAIGLLCFSLLDANLSTRFDYWSIFSPYEQICWIMIAFAASTILSKLHGYELGRVSLPIYLLHIPFAGFFSARINLNFGGGLVLSIVIAVLIYGLLLLGMKLSQMLRIEKAYKFVTGIK